MIDKYDNVGGARFQVALGHTTPVQIFDSSTAARTPNQKFSAVLLTNVDPNITIVFGFDNTISATDFSFAIGPYGTNASELQRLGINLARNLWALALSGAPNVSVTPLS